MIDAWDFDAKTRARLNEHTQMIFYSAQLAETDQRLGKYGVYLHDLDESFFR